MNHPSELSSPSRCPKCGGTSWTNREREKDPAKTDWQCNSCREWLEDLARLDAEMPAPKPKEKEFAGYMRDPNMQAASDKITAILKEHDLMGVVLISGNATPPRSGFIHCLSPSWSAIRVHDHPNGDAEVRIRAKREDYPSVDAQRKHVTDTVCGLMGLLDVQKHLHENLLSLVGGISHSMEIQHVSHDPMAQRVRFTPPL